MFYLINIVCYLLFVVETYSASTKVKFREPVPGPVGNLSVTDDDGVVLHWNHPIENGAYVDEYRIIDYENSYGAHISHTKRHYHNVSYVMSVKECVPYTFLVESVNAEGKGSEAKVNYTLVPRDLLRSVSVEQEVGGLAFHFLNWTSHERACYDLISVEMCPNIEKCFNTGLIKAQNKHGALFLLIDNYVMPELTYNITISAKGSPNKYNFSKKMKGIDSTTAGHITDSTTTGSTTDSTTTGSTTDSTTTRKPTKPTIKNRTFNGNATLLNHIHELAENMKPNSSQVHGNLTISSFVTNVRETSTTITWQNEGAEVTLLEPAMCELQTNSSIKMVVVEEKTKSPYLGDIVEVITESRIENSYSSVLQIKFERRKCSNPNDPNWTCVYWDREISKWSERGIVTEFKPEFIVCSSYHLSTFSILLPDPNRNSFNQRHNENSFHQVWLTRISRFGSAITICFLVLVIVTNYGKKTGNETRKILMNSSFALLLMHGTYQIHTFLEGYSKCLNITFMKYYFVLAFLLWTAADGINMWRILLTDVFNTTGYKFYRWYKIISWGVPLITTTIGLFFMDSQGECTLQFIQIYDLIFYMVPWMIILGCNMLLFTWVLLNITCKNKLGRLKDKKIDYILALTQVFGISWCLVFPLLYFESTQLLGEYLLAGIISTQGLLIFTVRGGTDKTFKKKRRSYTSKLHTNSFNSLRKTISTVEFDSTTENQITIKQAILVRRKD